MREEIIQKLFDLNRNFYSRMADQFDSSRNLPWPGWQELWEYLEKQQFYPGTILDVGCGNGRFVKFISTKLTDFKYLGVDASRELLQIASKKYASDKISFEYLDLQEPLKLDSYFELITIFAVLHHIPGLENRASILKSFAGRLTNKGLLVFTAWNIARDPKLAKKILPWTEADFNESELEAGDLLLDWRNSGAFRYYHSFSDSEITKLLKLAGLKVELKYKQDGENHNLNTYFVCSLK